jgi:integrase
VTEQKRGRGRPRKATPIKTKSGHSSRVWLEEDGVWRRKQIPLGTKSRVIAKQKAKCLVDGSLTLADAARAETFEIAAERIVGQSEISTKDTRLSRLRTYAFPIIGDMPVGDITVTEIKDCLALIEEGVGGWTGSVRHLKNDISAVLGVLYSDNIIGENAALRIKFNRKGGSLGGRKIQRVYGPRIMLTDEEIERVVAHGLDLGEGQLPELYMLIICSRCLGGMRTSDLHAWRWEHIDTRQWLEAFVPRPKTDKEEEGSATHALPDPLVPHLIAWWKRHGCPTEGPVFPARRGKRAGQHKRPGMSYAETLRAAVWEAGVVRPLPGFARAKTEEARRKLCAIQAGTEKFDCLDFHSFRGGYSTALDRSGVSLREAMRATDHADERTHRRYARNQDRIVVPESSIPRILPPTAAEIATAKTENPMISSAPGRIRTFDPWLRRPPGIDTNADSPRLSLVDESSGDVAPPSPTRERQKQTPETVGSGEAAATPLEGLRAAARAAVDAGNWALVDSLRPLIDSEAGRLAAPVATEPSTGVIDVAAFRKRRGKGGCK